MFLLEGHHRQSGTATPQCDTAATVSTPGCGVTVRWPWLMMTVFSRSINLLRPPSCVLSVYQTPLSRRFRQYFGQPAVIKGIWGDFVDYQSNICVQTAECRRLCVLSRPSPFTSQSGLSEKAPSQKTARLKFRFHTSASCWEDSFARESNKLAVTTKS